MTKKKRDEEHSLNKKYIPKERKEFLDFDYINKLDVKSKKWLAKFSDEYYGASFSIRDTYIKENDKFICINDKDLRKYRKITKYYKDKKGNFTSNIEYKYSDNNLHKTPNARKSCNQTANSIARDLFNKNIKNNNTKKGIIKNDDELLSFEYNLDVYDDNDINYISPEHKLILKEDMIINYNLLSENEREEVFNINIIKKDKKRLTKKRKFNKLKLSLD